MNKRIPGDQVADAVSEYICNDTKLMDRTVTILRAIDCEVEYDSEMDEFIITKDPNEVFSKFAEHDDDDSDTEDDDSELDDEDSDLDDGDLDENEDDE